MYAYNPDVILVLPFLTFAVDCEWEYGEFGECSKTCGGGTKFRYPIITTHPAHGGEGCPQHVVDNVPDSMDCNPQMCPSESHMVAF